jgi:hypothetical protein
MLAMAMLVQGYLGISDANNDGLAIGDDRDRNDRDREALQTTPVVSLL